MIQDPYVNPRPEDTPQSRNLQVDTDESFTKEAIEERVGLMSALGLVGSLRTATPTS